MPYVRPRNSATFLSFSRRSRQHMRLRRCMSLSGAATNMSRYDAQSSTISGTLIQTMSRDPGMLHCCRSQSIGGWLNSAFRIPHFEIGPGILCRARQAFKVRAASCSIGLCEVLFRWKVHEKRGALLESWNFGKNNSCQQADEVPGLAYCDTDETRVFSGSCLSRRSCSSTDRGVVNVVQF